MTQTKQNTSTRKAQSPNAVLASTDFDDWAKAVRQQMLNCLHKRSSSSSVISHRDRAE